MGHARRNFAVVVGVSQYDALGTSSLRYTNNDARRLAEVLVKFGSFELEDVHLFCDDGEGDSAVPSRPPTRSDILDVTKSVAEAANPGDLLLFFFAGHGNQISDKSYLLTNDTRLNVIDETAIRVKTVAKYLDDSKAQLKLRIFDACRAVIGERGALSPRMTRGFKEVLLTEASGSATLLACTEGQMAHEIPELKQGLFSYYLCEGLAGKAGNEAGIVTLDRLIDYLRASVANWCTRYGLKQTPQAVYDIAGSLELSSAPGELAISEPTPNYSDPLVGLSVFLNDFLSGASPELRTAQYTDPQSDGKALSILRNLVTDRLKTSSDSGLTFSLTQGTQPLAHINNRLYTAYTNTRSATGLTGKVRADAQGFKVMARSQQAIIPDCDLVITVTRLSCLYWLWWGIQFVPKKESRWSPKQETVSSFRAFSPTAILDSAKVGTVVRHALDEMTQAMQGWCKEAGEHLEPQVTATPETGPIIR